MRLRDKLFKSEECVATIRYPDGSTAITKVTNVKQLQALEASGCTIVNVEKCLDDFDQKGEQSNE